jgi:hypothetical protein
MGIHYKVPQPDEDGWTPWRETGWTARIMCCDCGLVHRFEFRVAGEEGIDFRAKRDVRATAARRAWLRRKAASHTK